MKLRLDPFSPNGVSIVEDPVVINTSSTSQSFATVGTDLPATGQDGQLFYDTDDALLYVYANGTWNVISGGGAVGTWDFVDGTSVEFIDGSAGDFVV